MLKKIVLLFIFSFTFTFTLSLSAIDSGTVSATLYYRVEEEIPDREATGILFHALLQSLQEEGAPDNILESAAQTAQLFFEGRDVKESVKELWQQLIGAEEEPAPVADPIFSSFRKLAASYNLKNNPLIDDKHYKAIKSWILPKDHPMKMQLDNIFTASRAIQDNAAFDAAGFQTFAIQPRSYIRVARHPQLPGYVVKVYLDTELKLKKKKPGWSWFAKRCEGAKRIAETLKRKEIQHFKVSKKWIYPLPLTPVSPIGAEYSPKAEILIAEDMNITSHKDSQLAWKTVMTKAHLDELYVIIAYANGHSYRPDNIPYSNDGKFAFIDTEYPDRLPDYSTPMLYFNPEMVDYWKQLMSQGGP